ncbi:uncharacterized protein CDAR_198671 [Caerostris darwini]|uniref:Uncharacterized protein n=1 Tax=Caerostris darwini TaxID=1538125 RepID=A0AAV4W5N4_9ARAC|nr:uncharacterized protein CDAR_198671 [Caerostris darwini]
MVEKKIKGKGMCSPACPPTPGDVGILLKELTPRRRLREEHVLLTIDFPGTQHEFTLVLERIRGRGMCPAFSTATLTALFLPARLVGAGPAR